MEMFLFFKRRRFNLDKNFDEFSLNNPKIFPYFLIKERNEREIYLSSGVIFLFTASRLNLLIRSKIIEKKPGVLKSLFMNSYIFSSHV